MTDEPGGLAHLLVKALALGDLETVEHCALALVTGDEVVHADYGGAELVQVERHLQAFLYALPPFHKNPCRREHVEARIRSRRLVGCYTAIATVHSGPELPASIHGTITEDLRDAWAIRTRQKSVNGGKPVELTVVVPLDSIAACEIRPNEAQYRAHGLDPSTTPDEDLLASYLGQPSWSWFGRLAPRATP